MFEKTRVKSEINKRKKQIEALEQKRYRSQASLVSAILNDKSPEQTDVDYFNKYTDDIQKLRASIHDLQAELDSLE